MILFVSTPDGVFIFLISYLGGWEYMLAGFTSGFPTRVATLLMAGVAQGCHVSPYPSRWHIWSMLFGYLLVL